MGFDLLWYNDAPWCSDLEKVEQAAAHYQSKFGHRPTTCFVHPAISNLKELQEAALKQLGINVCVITGRVPAPYHFRVGVNGNGKTGSRPAKKKGPSENG